MRLAFKFAFQSGTWTARFMTGSLVTICIAVVTWASGKPVPAKYIAGAALVGLVVGGFISWKGEHDKNGRLQDQLQELAEVKPEIIMNYEYHPDPHVIEDKPLYIGNLNGGTAYNLRIIARHNGYEAHFDQIQTFTVGRDIPVCPESVTLTKRTPSGVSEKSWPGSDKIMRFLIECSRDSADSVVSVPVV